MNIDNAVTLQSRNRQRERVEHRASLNYNLIVQFLSSGIIIVSHSGLTNMAATTSSTNGKGKAAMPITSSIVDAEAYEVPW